MSAPFVTVARYDNVPMAEVARLRLEDAGIPAHIQNAELVTAIWYYGTAFGHVQLHVPAEHAERAGALLADLHDSGLPQGDEVADEVAPRCLACGADFPQDAERCPDCGWSYSDPGAEQDDATSISEADDAAFCAESDGTLTLTQLRSVGRPLIGAWVAVIIGSMLTALIAGVLSILGDLFR